ncbi:Homeodomain protein [Pseudocohnilembus persalinus]|uniref:Homeodomain protein n=1 Tax=Pseudocohnilembus persalinus TaxID=266149 RepID=A0A0V0QC21_PSEPJ|nr:Homeodomain protein [Pseudocohnilembus persalinus]|eukprot:KRW99752.1 Homeodomain protein [Pseudocohnilembus persalinus]
MSPPKYNQTNYSNFLNNMAQTNQSFNFNWQNNNNSIQDDFTNSKNKNIQNTNNNRYQSVEGRNKKEFISTLNNIGKQAMTNYDEFKNFNKNQQDQKTTENFNIQDQNANLKNFIKPNQNLENILEIDQQLQQNKQNTYRQLENQIHKHNFSNEPKNEIKYNKPKGKICASFKKGNCKFGSKCKFVHDKQQTQPKVCKMYVQGRCTYGKLCKFSHGDEEQKLTINNEEDDLLNKLQQQQLQSYQNKIAQSQDQFQNQNQQQQSEIGQIKKIQDNSQVGRKKSDDKPRKKSEQQQQNEETIQNVQQEVKNSGDKYYKDISKSEESQKIFQNNLQEIFKGDFIEHLKSLNNFWEKDLAQFQRKYQCSFKWVNRDIENSKVFQIKHVPTMPKNSLTEMNFELKEGYLWFEIVLPEDYPKQCAEFQLLNSSIPSFLDNNLNDFCAETKEIMALKEKKDQEEKQKKIEEYKQKLIEEANAPWSQEEQSHLEQAIKEFKNITDKDEKWQKISEFVETKNVNQCLARFQFCKEKALQQREKQLQKAEKQEEESELDSEEDSYEEDSNESGEEDYSDSSESEYEDDGYANRISNEKYEDSDDEEENYDNNDQQNKQVQQLNKDGQKIGVEFNITCTLKDMNMQKLSLCRISDCQVSVKCNLCQFPAQFQVSKFLNKNSDEILINESVCVNCNHVATLYLKRIYVHPYEEPIICRMGSATWDILDMLNLGLELNCSECNFLIKQKNYVSGNMIQGKCHQCFQSYSFQYFGIQIQRSLSEFAEKINKKKENEQLKQDVNLIKKKKVGIFKLGQPLPANGICSHYKNSFRYFRFPCCGKAYPCDICHQNGEAKDHEQEYAKAMICGFCGKEQAVKQTCTKCNSKLTKIPKKGGHWENGEGVRDKKKMCSKDKQKYRGMNKTISKKKKQTKKKK